MYITKKPLFIILSLIISSFLFAANRTVRLGINCDYNPNTNCRDGYEYVYFQEIAKYTGWNYEYIDISKSNDFSKNFLNNEIDMIPYGKIYNNNTSVVSSDYSVMDFTYYVFKHSNDTSIKDFDYSTYNNKRIGTVKNSYINQIAVEFANKHNINFEFIYFDNFKELEAAFNKPNSQIDLLFYSDYLAQNVKNITPINKAGTAEIFYAFHSKDKALLKEFNQAQKMLINEKPNFKQELKQRYYQYFDTNKQLNSVVTSYLESHDTITIGYAAHWFPFCSIDKHGEIQGFLPQYIDEVLRMSNIDSLKVNYVAFSTFEEAVEALKNKEIDLVFPIFGDYNLTEKLGLSKTDNVLELTMCIVYDRSQDFDKITKIISRRDFHIYDNYKKHSLPNYEGITQKFLFSRDLQKVLKQENCGVLVNKFSADTTISDSKYRNVQKVELPDKCHISIAARKEDVGLIKLFDYGIYQIDDVFKTSLINKITYQHLKYTFNDFIRDNIFFVLLLIILFTFLVFVISFQYIKMVQRINAQVDEARIQAEAANEAKTSFLFNMSHDIRTPMNAIIGYTKLLRKHQSNVKKRQDYLDKIDESSNVLLSIINNVLEMARIEKGTLELNENVRNVEQFNNEIYSIFADMMKQKGITFTRKITTNTHFVYCDTIKLKEIFINILSNAYKYTNSGGKVSIDLEEIPCSQEGYCLFKTTISDTGIGMSQDFLDHIFDEFSREHTTTDNKIEGTGLGMAIVKRLVDFMNGSINVTSEKDKGTTFVVEIPHKIANKEDMIENDSVEINPIFFNDKRILLVEDNNFNAEIASELLMENGFIVERLENGLEAVEALSKSPNGYYDIVLMDIQMPLLNGYDATIAIRKLNNGNENIPIIAMTANAFEEDKKVAIQSGMNGHISKPIDMSELLNSLSKVFQNKTT